jgi:alkylhydroperoxidase/carboxymuconolactone decarboxylase family protein YurZ
MLGDCAKPRAIDAKNKDLLFIDVKIVAGDQGAATAHVPSRRSFGAIREEIRLTVLITIHLLA